MKTSLRLSVVAAALFAVLALGACDDDDGTGPGNGGNGSQAPAVASVTPVDSLHLNVKFDEFVDRTSAEEESNYTITAAGGGGVSVLAASLFADGQTVALTLDGGMTTQGYVLSVVNVADVNGNAIVEPSEKQFIGSSAGDHTPPQIVLQTPARNATNVSRTQVIQIQFSEPLEPGVFASAFAMDVDGDPVPFTITSTDDLHYTVTPVSVLDANETYHLSLTGIQDAADNLMTDTAWTLRTTANTSGPELVSTSPNRNAANVDPLSLISMTFSESINPTSFNAQIIPGIGSVEPSWTNNNRTVTYDPPSELADDQQYTVTLMPGDVTDVLGNTISEPIVFTFTTATQLETGRISGHVSGDAGSSQAGDPTGANVVLASSDPLSGGDFTVLGVTTVATNNTYTFNNVPAGTYYPFVVMDSNDDGLTDPLTGDAVGAFGADIGAGDVAPEGVVVAEGEQVSAINFELHDPSAITGAVVYSGVNTGEVLVGLFPAAGFNPATSVAVATVPATGTGTLAFNINTLTAEDFPEGNYVVAAFMDVNGNDVYDAGVDPYGVYGGTSYDAIDVSDGEDTSSVNVTLFDPLVSATRRK